MKRKIQKDNESLNVIYVLLKGTFYVNFFTDFSAVSADYSELIANISSEFFHIYDRFIWVAVH